MADLLPRIPLEDDIRGMQMSQLQAYCLAWELPITGLKIEDLRNNLMSVRQIVGGDPDNVSEDQLKALFDGWAIEGDYSTCPPDNIAVVLVGYAAALALRYNAIGYCRTPSSMTNKQPETAFVGTGECDISVTVEAVQPQIDFGIQPI